MLRRCGAPFAVLAVLVGLSAAPYTHAHHAIDSVSDERHPHGESLVHAHASPHAHHHADHPDPEPAEEEEGDGPTWAVDSFLFQQLEQSHAPSPILLVFAKPHVQLRGIWLGAPRMQPRAHGPPVELPSGLRAPPAFLPLFS